MNPIGIRQARLHNLNGFDITIPQDKLVVVSGVSGSGKSTLIFDILFEEGRKRYLHTIGALSELNSDVWHKHVLLRSIDFIKTQGLSAVGIY